MKSGLVHILFGGAAILALICGPSASHAGSAQGSWEIYGQLNLGALTVDNGAGSETYFAENPHVPSRLGARFQLPVQGTAELTFQVETGFGLTNLSEVSPSNENLNIDIDRTVLRRFEVIYGAPSWGALSLGQGSMASDGASGTDLSGTGLAHGPAIADLGGGTPVLFARGTPSGLTVADIFDDLDGPRRLRVRYDTPDWRGVTLAMAYGQEVLRSGNDLDYRDIALRYSRATDLFTAEAAASYEWIGQVEERFLVSAALLHMASGLNVTAAHGANRIGDGNYAYVKLGWTGELVPTGRTAIALEYYDGDDFGFAGSSSHAVGLGLTHSIARLNIDLVAALRRYNLTSNTDRYADVTVTMIGARWRF